MANVPSRELRNNTRDLIVRAKQGETIVITVDGIPMAELQSVDAKQKWMKKEFFIQHFVQADSAMSQDIRDGFPSLDDVDLKRTISRKPQ